MLVIDNDLEILVTSSVIVFGFLSIVNCVVDVWGKFGLQALGGSDNDLKRSFFSLVKGHWDSEFIFCLYVMSIEVRNVWKIMAIEEIDIDKT